MERNKLKTALLLVEHSVVSRAAFFSILGDGRDLSSTVWLGGRGPVLAALLVEILRSLLRGELGWTW